MIHLVDKRINRQQALVHKPEPTDIIIDNGKKFIVLELDESNYYFFDSFSRLQNYEVVCLDEQGNVTTRPYSCWC